MSTKRSLTATQVLALKEHGVHWCAPGLYLQIRPQGTRSWLFRYARGGKNQWMGLGAASDKSLSEARDEAALLRVQVRRGADPMAAKESARVVTPRPKREIHTFADCAERYIETHRSAWKNDKHIAQWSSTILTYANPVIGKMDVADIEVSHVLAILAPIWTAKEETSSRLRGRIEKVLGWAAAHGYRSAENPAKWAGGALPHLLPPQGKKVEHRGSMPYMELQAFVARLRSLESASADALLLTILTASRTSETLGAKWTEVDFAARIWVVPASRMKAGKEHRVPLSNAAIELLNARSRDGDYIIPGQRPKKPLSNMSMLMLLRGLDPHTKATVHGFRSTFSTWAAEQTNHDREVVEACLAHETGNAVEMAYKRTDFIETPRRHGCLGRILSRGYKSHLKLDTNLVAHRVLCSSCSIRISQRAARILCRVDF